MPIAMLQMVTALMNILCGTVQYTQVHTSRSINLEHSNYYKQQAVAKFYLNVVGFPFLFFLFFLFFTKLVRENSFNLLNH